MTATDQASAGIFVLQGMQVHVDDFRLAIGDEGQIDTSFQLKLVVEYWPSWFRIAVEHERQAYQARQQLLAAVDGGTGVEKGNALNDELPAGMVAIAASAFTFDAVYGSVAPRLKKPPTFGPDTARAKRIAEVLRRGFAPVGRTPSCERSCVPSSICGITASTRPQPDIAKWAENLPDTVAEIAAARVRPND